MYYYVKTLQTKLQILENQLRTSDAFHLLILANHRSESGYDRFAVKLNEVKNK